MPDPSILLTLKAGTSSVKLSAYANSPGLPRLALGQIEGLSAAPRFSVRSGDGPPQAHAIFGAGADADHSSAVHTILAWLNLAHTDRPVRAVSHRVVHGGMDLLEAVMVDDELMGKLERLVPLAPLHQLHQLHNLTGIRAAQARLCAARPPGALVRVAHTTRAFRDHATQAPRQHDPRAVGDHRVRTRHCTRMGDMLKGLRGLVAGVANGDSIAFGCTAKLPAFGAEVALTYLNEKVQGEGLRRTAGEADRRRAADTAGREPDRSDAGGV